MKREIEREYEEKSAAGQTTAWDELGVLSVTFLVVLVLDDDVAAPDPSLCA